MSNTAAEARTISFSSSDPSETRAFLDAAYGWQTTAQRPDPEERPLTIDMVDADILNSAHAVAPGDMSYRVHGEDYVVFDTLLRGRFELAHADRVDRYGPGDVYIANRPDAEFDASTHDISVRTTTLPTRVLAEVAGSNHQTADAAPVRFAADTPIVGDSRLWRNASRYIDILLSDPTTAKQPLIIGPAARYLAAVALATFPNTVEREPTAQDRIDAHPELLRRAIVFIEANPDIDISPADIARAARSTPRAVELAFQRHLGTTPSAYLKRVRLDRAHTELQAISRHDADDEDIALVAARWGYPDLTRFLVDYRAEHRQDPMSSN